MEYLAFGATTQADSLEEIGTATLKLVSKINAMTDLVNLDYDTMAQELGYANDED